MNGTASSEDDVIVFAEKLFLLLDEARHTATYKLAVLLGLMDFRSQLGDASVSLIKARLTNRQAYSRLVDRVERKLIEEPLPRLQTIGTSVDSFVYHVNWGIHVIPRDITAYRNHLRLAEKPRFALEVNNVTQSLTTGSTRRPTRLQKPDFVLWRR